MDISFIKKVPASSTTMVVGYSLKKDDANSLVLNLDTEILQTIL